MGKEIERERERPREAYCLNCKMFFHVDDAGYCVECGHKILEPKAKPKKKKPKPS